MWAGPGGEGPDGGVTQSMLSKFLTCRERFRLYVVDGLRPAEAFSAPLEFGQMWHTCEEAHAGRGVHWETALTEYTRALMAKYPMQREQVAEWHGKAVALFPLYEEHWSRHPDVTGRTPLLSEQTFDVPYKLPSGRTVRLRGKWDSVDLVDGAVWLQDNKTKSSIDGTKIARQITFDLQTMLYLVSLETYLKTPPGLGDLKASQIRGVRYNVVRRSAHKSVESMLKKVDDDRSAGRIGEWFARWTVEVSPADVAKFRTRCLDPVLESLCQWWDWVVACKEVGEDPFGSLAAGEDDHAQALHWVSPFSPYPYGVIEGGTDMDDAVLTGGTVGLRRVDHLFEELA